MVKDILREIKKKWFQFVAILIITALGVGFFVGIQVTGYNMRMTADNYSKTREIMDFLLSSSLGVDETMIESLSNELRHDAKVYGVVSGDAFLHTEGFDHVVHAYQYTDDTSIDLTLEEGRLPQSDGEFVVDSVMAKRLQMELGSKYSLIKSDVLKNQELVLVGTVNSSLYFNQERGQSKLGTLNGFIYTYGLETKEDVYTEIRVIAKEDVSVDLIKNKINGVKESLVDERYHRIIDPLIKELDDAQIELDDKRVEVHKEFDTAWNDIVHSEMLLADSKNEIINGVKEIYPEAVGSNYLDYYDNSVQHYKELKESTLKELALNRQQIALMPEGPEKVGALMMLEAQEEEFLQSMKLVDDAHAQLKEGILSIDQGDKDLLIGKETFAKEKQDALRKLDDAQIEIDKGYQEIDDLDTGNFYVLDRNTVIVGYTSFYDDSKRIESIGKVFPLVFFGVAVLVTLSTITRMIDESRIEIGIYKALGYSKMRTTLKFTGFTFYSWFIGAGLGLLLGFLFIPILIYNAYRIMYITPELVTGFIIQYAWLPVLFSFLASVGISFVRSYRVASETTASLLMPPSPKKGQRIFLERIGFLWNRLSFLYKVSLRNLFRNKTRFLMTLVGIGGCCGLLITGFGIQYSINSIVDKQFDEIIQYDAVVAYESGFKLEDSLVQKTTYSNVLVEQVSVDGKDVSIYAVDSLSEFSELVTLKNRKTGKLIPVTQDDVVITEKLAIMNDIKIGDTITFFEGDRSYSVEVTQIAENYVAHYIYMSKAKLKEVLGYNKASSLVLMSYEATDVSEWAQELRNEDGVLSVNILRDMKFDYKEMMGSFDIVIIVIVIAAFALELIVLLNLISMNMSERSKELATLKVLGFYPKELASYILRENIVLSALSLFVGVGFGFYLHRFVLLSAEIDMIMFNRTLRPSAVLLACVLTFVLSLLINLVMSRKANQVNMAEALKSD